MPNDELINDEITIGDYDSLDSDIDPLQNKTMGIEGVKNENGER